MKFLGLLKILDLRSTSFDLGAFGLKKKKKKQKEKQLPSASKQSVSARQESAAGMGRECKGFLHQPLTVVGITSSDPSEIRGGSPEGT